MFMYGALLIVKRDQTGVLYPRGSATHAINQGLRMTVHSICKPRIYEPARLMRSENKPRNILGRIPISDNPFICSHQGLRLSVV